MRKFTWEMRLGALLILLSVLLYAAHYAIFRDAHHIFLYLLGDIAFIPIDVLIVTLIIHRVLVEREKKQMLHKLNMIVGTFFGEAGTDLIRLLGRFDPLAGERRVDFAVTPRWNARAYATAKDGLRRRPMALDARLGNLEPLRTALDGFKPALLRMLEHPILIEHETFSDLLWAVFHLQDEMAHRGDLTALPGTDLAHLSGDMTRAAATLAAEWLDYMAHLQSSYPYLFSLAVRTNPFDPDASPVVR